ncbi:uncharacterized protein K460DRAFT_371308 [Cucurbitaria berberidis CBS 394.84]|uniref:C2H2-type domain-containing protein n=1 Tax=Cucurbitaria berberidis CBS 394.84 TaxID=1168544 RepID=A0A9P4G6U1_9PLEO|nr:uncharacterized protein K460DRAFT_371308 [Cucurbitaria berberidis CBS 394.84]KAF1840091.1 hypothetical protein K460DRAFT_371308 [Cucurbitaria berberidis CBS 394.84]
MKGGARVVDLEDLKRRARQANAPPAPLTAEAVKESLKPSAYVSYKFAIQKWSSFSEDYLGKPVVDQRFTEAPTIHEIKLYLEWLAQTCTGTIDEAITDSTAFNRFNSLKRAINIHTGHKYTKQENEAVSTFILTDLVRRGLVSTSAHAKPIATYPVAKDILWFLIASDEHQTLHSRTRVQLVFLIQIMAFTGVRPGEVIESDAWPNSNEGLLYKDIDLVYSQNKDNPGWRINVRLRNRKGHREYKKHAPIIILCERPRQRWMCPVTWFLSLAFADNAFSDLVSYDDLENAKPIVGSEFYTAKYKPGVRERPVMRNALQNGTISDTRIWTYDSLNSILKNVGQRAGYQEKLSAYCFRRAFARAVEKVATALERRTLLSHNSDSTGQSYVSGFVGIDCQSIVLGEEQRPKLYDEASSMMAKRNLLAPRPSGSTLTEPRRVIDVTMSSLSSAQMYQLRRRGRAEAYQKDREAFLEGTGSPTRAGEMRQATSLKQTPSRKPSRYLKAVLKFELERKAIIDLMFSDGELHDELSFQTILGPLIKLAMPQKKCWAYVTAEPTNDGRCRVCRTDQMHGHLLQCARQRRINEERERMAGQFALSRTCLWNDCDYRFEGKPCEMYVRHVARHLDQMRSHQCLWAGCCKSFERSRDLAHHISKEHRVPNEWTMPTRMHYCYEHGLWCQSDEVWDAHLQKEHFDVLDRFCGLIKDGGVVGVAAHCLCCLGADKPLPVRFAQFTDIDVLHRHIKSHLERFGVPNMCPHPLCEDALNSESDFWSHANVIHGVTPFGPRRTKRKTPDSDSSEMDQRLNKRSVVEIGTVTGHSDEDGAT